MAVLVALLCAGVSERQLRCLPAAEVDRNLLFVPSPTLVKGFASGYGNILADSFWLGWLQYFGERYVADDRTLHHADEMLTLITDLDPHFWFAYWFGAWALADNGEANAAIALLERGEMRNPREFNYPFLQGLIRFLSRSDYLGAAACFERALTKPIVEHAEQPRFARTMAARMYQEAGQDDLALNLWRALEAQSREAMVIEIARRNIQRIQAERRHARARVFGRRKKTH